jgi:hypothetical protein
MFAGGVTDGRPAQPEPARPEATQEPTAGRAPTEDPLPVWPAEPPVDVPAPDEPAGVVAGPLPEEPAEPPGAGAKPPAGAVAEPLPEGLADLPTGAADGPGRPGRRGELPEGLADLPTGAELAAVLATIDRSRLSDADVYDLLAARARQLAHDQAQLLADLRDASTPSGPRCSPTR